MASKPKYEFSVVEHLLGTIPDKKIAAMIGCSARNVSYIRKRRGIASVHHMYGPKRKNFCSGCGVYMSKAAVVVARNYRDAFMCTKCYAPTKEEKLKERMTAFADRRTQFIQEATKPEIITRLQGDIIKPGIEKYLIPLVLYKGCVGLGRAHSLWNFAVGMMHAECESRADAVALSQYSEYAHKKIASTSLQSFFARLYQHKKVTDLIPGFTEYVQYFANKNRCVYAPTPIDIVSRDPDRPPNVPWREWEPVSRTPKHRVFKFRNETQSSMPYPFVIGSAKPEFALMYKVNDAVSKRLPEHIRADVCQDLIVSVLAGEIRESDIEDSIKKYTQKVLRDHPFKYGPLSLDQPAPWATDGTLLKEFL